MNNIEQNRVWIVTGASRGIGLAVAASAADLGAQVVLLARGQNVTEVAKKCGPRCIGFSCDVSNSEEVKSVVDEVFKSFGHIDVVVNNAGFHKGGKISRLEQEDWKDVRTGKACGRKKGEKRGTPYCRPSKRVSSKTPKTSSEMTAAEKKSRVSQKKRLGQPAGKPRRVKSLKRRKKK